MRNRSGALLSTLGFLSSFAVLAQTPTSLTLDGSSSCGKPVVVSIHLSAPAPADDGLTIELASSVPNIVPVPKSTKAKPGSMGATFSVTCVPTVQAMAVTITATANGGSASGILNVLAPVLDRVDVRSVTDPTRRDASVKLIGPAPAGGVVVTLTNSNPSRATVPGNVTVPAGEDGVKFVITDVDPVNASTTLTITGTGLGVTKTTTFTIEPFGPSSLVLGKGTTFSATRTIIGGPSQSGKVTLSGIAGTGGNTVLLTSSNPTAAPVPPSVVVPAGETEAMFNFDTLPVAQNVNVNITAALGSVSKTAVLTIQAPTIDSITSTSTLIGGQNTQGTAYLTGDAPSGGTVVNLVSNNTTRLIVPPSVTVPAGASNVHFQISTSAVESPTSVTVTGSTAAVSKTKTVSVVPQGPTAVTLNPSSVTGGTSVSGQVTAVASTTSFDVLLMSSDTSAATVPSPITFAPGQTSQSFTVTTKPVAGRKSVTITARAGQIGETSFSPMGGVSSSGSYLVERTASLTVKPPEPTQLTLNPPSVFGPANVTATITLNKPAPPGLTIDARSSNGTFASVFPFTAAAGSATQTFTVSAQGVEQDANVTITVTIDGISKTATLNVRAPN